MKPLAAKKQKKNMPPSLEGQTLGKYRILDALGRGGMAQVYRAYHPQLDRYVAVKVLRSDLVEEKEFLARFSREARAVAALRHPNIVQVYDFDMQDGYYYMVMELLEGNTLKAYLNAFRTGGGRMPAGEMMRILSDALAGLEYAHKEGIVHRDLKPANIMLSRHGQAVLTDFGIAQIVGVTQYTVSGALMGTLSYMAPEQGLSGKCDARSDLYSLGIVYYEMLTGRVPFDADTPLAILMKHVNDPLPLPRKIDPAIPETLERVALKSLAKQPEQRYQSAAEMAAALQDAATRARIETPATFSLPIPAASTPVPSGPVAVFSGTARQKITDRSFASGDTDTTLKEKLARQARQPVEEEGLPDKIVTGVFRALFKPPSQVTAADIRRRYVAQAAVYGSLTIVLANICALWAGGITGWKIYAHAWPMELILVGLLLSALMAALATPWMLIPAGLVLGNGMLLSYYTLTGWWSHWVFLWPLEPLLLAAAILGSLWLAKQGQQGRWASRRLGLLFLALAVVLQIGLLIASAVLSVLGR
jgi:serine/threonine protein kinase